MSPTRPLPTLQHLTRLARPAGLSASPSHPALRRSSTQASTSASSSYWNKLADWLPRRSSSPNEEGEKKPRAVRLPGASVEEVKAGGGGKVGLERGPSRPPGEAKVGGERVKDKGKGRVVERDEAASTKALPASVQAVHADMRRLIATRRPRRALHLLRTLATSPSQDTSSTDLITLASTFLPAHTDLYISALSFLHSRGYAIPPATAASLVKSCAFELSTDPKALATVVGWLGEGLRAPIRTRQEREGMEVLCEGVMEGLKRMGKPEAVEDVFEAYAASFEPSGKRTPTVTHTNAPLPTHPGVGPVSALISSRGLYSTLTSARAAFDTWRAAYLATNPNPSTSHSATPPPARPYLTLLAAYAQNPPPPHSSPLSDPAYSFLPLLARDGLPLSPHTFALLIKLELSRRQFGSCWGLWEVMGRGGWRRGGEVWAAGVKALRWEGRGVKGRREGSPLARMAGYSSRTKGLSGRELLGQLLVAEQDLTQGRPRLVHPDRAIFTELLNAFLAHFIQQTDLPAAVVVLETFAVHALEPDRATHSTVVLGLVDAWKAGKVGRKLEEAAEVDFGELHELHELHDRDPRARRAERRRTWDPVRPRVAAGAADAERERAAMVLVRRLLEGRQMRVGLWTNPAELGRAKLGLLGELEEEQAAEAGMEGQPPAPEWMARRELRDTSYLRELLRRASGLEGLEWRERLELVRGEVLPRRWRGGEDEGSGEGELVEGKGLRRAGREERLAAFKAKQAAQRGRQAK